MDAADYSVAGFEYDPLVFFEHDFHTANLKKHTWKNILEALLYMMQYNCYN